MKRDEGLSPLDSEPLEDSRPPRFKEANSAHLSSKLACAGLAKKLTSTDVPELLELYEELPEELDVSITGFAWKSTTTEDPELLELDDEPFIDAVMA